MPVGLFGVTGFFDRYVRQYLAPAAIFQKVIAPTG